MYLPIKLLVCMAVVSACATARADLMPADSQATAIAAPTSQQRAADAVRSAPLFQGTFAMSSGRPLSVLSGGLTVRIRYDGRPQLRLRFDGEGAFVSDDGRVVLTFEMDDLESPTVQTLRLPVNDD